MGSRCATDDFVFLGASNILGALRMQSHTLHGTCYFASPYSRFPRAQWFVLSASVRNGLTGSLKKTRDLFGLQVCHRRFCFFGRFKYTRCFTHAIAHIARNVLLCITLLTIPPGTVVRFVSKRQKWAYGVSKEEMGAALSAHFCGSVSALTANAKARFWVQSVHLRRAPKCGFASGLEVSERTSRRKFNAR